MSSNREKYIACINRAIDYMERNLSRKISLERAAKESGFSVFHFHRIFTAFMGETPGGFLKRLRLERSAWILKGSPLVPITIISLRCGFGSSQMFSREFRNYFGKTPSEYRAFFRSGDHIFWKGKKRQDAVRGDMYASYSRNKDIKMNMDMKAEIKELPEMTVAYIRHIGPYKGDEELFCGLYGRLFGWAGARGLIGPDMKVLAIYHDDPAITDEEKLRTDICMTIPENTEVGGEVGKQTIAGGRYAMLNFKVKGPADYEKAWTEVYRDWLPDSGYECDGGRSPYELSLTNPNRSEDGSCEIAICIPIK